MILDPLRDPQTVEPVGVCPNSVRPRLSELAEWGMIRAIGKAKNRYGRSVTLWAAVEQDIKNTAPDGANIDGGKTAAQAT